MRTLKSRAIATAAAAAIALTTFSLQPAAAASRGNGAAAFAAFAVVLGTVAAIVAAEQYRDQPAYAPGYGGYGYDGGYGPGYRGQGGHWQHQGRW
jgi:hypothetical protein